MSGKGTEGEDDPATGGSRLARLAAMMRAVWESGDPDRSQELFAFASEAFDDRARGYLANKYRLDLDAVEDCVAEALEILLRKWRKDAASVSEPYAYLWGTAQRRALVMRRALLAMPLQPMEEDGAGGDLSEPMGDMSMLDEEVALVWYEELTEEAVSPQDRDWVKEVIILAVGRLPTALRQAAEFMLRPEFDHRETSAKEGSDALGISASAFRQNRHRALERLRKAIPEIIEELGIQLSHREAETVFVDQPRPGEEE